MQFIYKGVMITDDRSNASAYLHGVQDFNFDLSSNYKILQDIGRMVPDAISLPEEITFSIKRVVANWSNDPTKLFSPFPHWFSAIVGSAYSPLSGPTTYKNAFLTNAESLSYSSYGDPSQRLRSFTVDLAYSKKNNQFAGGEIDSKTSFNKSLLTNVSYNISTGGVLEESLSFVSAMMNDTEAPDFVKSVVTLGEVDSTNKNLNLIKGMDFDKGLSVLPEELIDYTPSDYIVDNSIVYGIQDIQVDLNLTYKRFADTGQYAGSNSENSNKWALLNIPVGVSCSFTCNNNKTINNIFRKKIRNLNPSLIRLVFRCSNYDLSNTVQNYFVINLGSNNRLQSIKQSGGSTSGGESAYSLDYINSHNNFCCYFTNHTNFHLIEQQIEKY